MKRLLLLTALLTASALAQTGNTTTINFAGVPAGTCGPTMFGVNAATGDLYDCKAGAWNLVSSAGGGGTVTSVGLTVNSTSPSGIYTVTGSPVIAAGTLNVNLAGTSGGIPYFSSGTVLSSSAALAANTIPKGGGAGVAPADSLVTDDATTLTYTGTGGLTTNGTGNQHTITQGTITTSKPFTTHTGTLNAAGVAFTNWLSNVTCTAAAANTKLFDLQVGGASKMSYQAFGTNCGTPVLLLADTAGQANLAATANSAGIELQASNVNIITNSIQSITFGRGNTSNGIITMVATSPLQWVASGTSVTGTVDTGVSRSAADVLAVGNGTNADTSGRVKAAGYMSVGTTFTGNAGCSETTLTGGATAGKFTAVSTSCTIVITMGNSATAPNGWDCDAHDLTTLADVTNPHQTATTTTTVTIVTGTIVSGDVISFSCIGY